MRAVDELSVVVLAAGTGRRLGLGPKAHVLLGGITFLARIVATCRTAGLVEINIVGNSTDERIRAACAELGVRLTLTTSPERGMSSSVCAGLESLQTGRGALVMPVDFPLVAASTVLRLAQAVSDAPDGWARPVVAGIGGHPVALGAAIIRRVAARGPSSRLRDSLNEMVAMRVDVPCGDAGVLIGIDAPDDLARAARHVAALAPSAHDRP